MALKRQSQHAACNGAFVVSGRCGRRIYKPSRSVMTSGRARTKGWRLTFERRTAPFIEPLMGWTGGDDTLTQVELSFPTREAAIRYAELQGLRYTVQSADGAADRKRPVTSLAHAFSDATLQKLGFKDLRESYGHAIDGAANRNDPSGPTTWGSPFEVCAIRHCRSMPSGRSS